MKELVITGALQEDIQEMLQIDRECLNGFWSELSYLNELAKDNSAMVVVRWGPQILAMGSMWLVCEECHLIMLAVRPAYQNQGIGSILVWQMLDHAHRAGASWVVLEVRASNTKAIGLYRQFGFSEVGIRKEYYADNKEDALVLWCKQINSPEFRAKLDHKKQQILTKLNDRGWHYSEGIKQIK